MKKRYVLLAGLAVGFVLGSRSGRQTYDKLKSEAEKVWNSPDVQAGVQCLLGQFQRVGGPGRQAFGVGLHVGAESLVGVHRFA